MATFSKRTHGGLIIVEATGKVEMVVLARSAKEYFTSFVDREAKKRGLQAVVNGSFTDLSGWNKFAVTVFRSPLDANESKPIGEVIEGGKRIAGSSSTGKFYLSQDMCGSQSFMSGKGDPPAASCAAVGGLAPIVVNGLPYGTINMYKAGSPPGGPLQGDVDSKHEK